MFDPIFDPPATLYLLAVPLSLASLPVALVLVAAGALLTFRAVLVLRRERQEAQEAKNDRMAAAAIRLADDYYHDRPLVPAPGYQRTPR